MIPQIQRPDLSKGNWLAFTEAHLNLIIELPKSAILLYSWLLIQAPAGIEIDFKLNNFLSWAKKFRPSEKAYSNKQISRNLKLLKEKELIKLSYAGLKVTAYHPPSTILANETKMSTERTKMSTERTKMSTERTKMSISEPEIIAIQDFSTPSDHSDNLDITITPEIVVLENFDQNAVKNLPEEKEPKIVDQEPQEPEQTIENKPEQQTEVKEKISARPANTNKLYQDCIKFLSPNPLSQNLKELLQNTNETTLLNSLAAVKEYCASHREINNKAGMLRTAIIEKWQPIKPPILDDSEEFKNWFKEQRPKGKVLGSTVKDGKILIYCSSGECLTFEEAKIKIPLE